MIVGFQPGTGSLEGDTTTGYAAWSSAPPMPAFRFLRVAHLCSGACRSEVTARHHLRPTGKGLGQARSVSLGSAPRLLVGGRVHFSSHELH